MSLGTFDKETIERIKSVPILEVAAYYGVEVVSESGNVHKARCPFHDDRNASLAFYTNSNSFYCFGCEAGKGGSDVISFVQQIEGCSFPRAVEIISERYGVPVQKAGVDEELERHLLANERTNDLFVKALRSSVPAQKYLLSRLPDKSLWRSWGIGMVPLDDRLYENVAGRLSFPIRDLSGRIRGWEFRSIDGSDPKTKCSIQSKVFDKKQMLPGIHRIKHRAERIILVEGFLDMLALEMHGVKDGCALIGSRLYQEQVELIKRRLAPDGYVILLLDGDPAGRKGTAAATSLLEEAGIRSLVLRLPDGTDPDDWSRTFKSPLELEEALAQARPLIHLQMLHAYENYMERMNRLQKRYADQAMELGRQLVAELRTVIAAHPKHDELEYYQGWVDSLTKDPGRLLGSFWLGDPHFSEASRQDGTEVKSAG